MPASKPAGSSTPTSPGRAPNSSFTVMPPMPTVLPVGDPSWPRRGRTMPDQNRRGARRCPDRAAPPPPRPSPIKGEGEEIKGEGEERGRLEAPSPLVGEGRGGG